MKLEDTTKWTITNAAVQGYLLTLFKGIRPPHDSASQ